jgi:hypothetical protein
LLPPVHSFGTCHWFPADDPHLVHQDDLVAFADLIPNGRVFECLGVSGEYLLLGYGKEQFRVHPRLYQPVPPPTYRIGDQVTAADEVAVICDLHWHFRNGAVIYYVNLGDGGDPVRVPISQLRRRPG